MILVPEWAELYLMGHALDSAKADVETLHDQ